MGRRSNAVWLAIVITFANLAAPLTAAESESAMHFDQPAESLSQALKDFAVQAKCNISYEPSLVGGLGAPAVKGDYPRSVALSMLLAGTTLKAVNIDESTIRVLRDTAAERLANSGDRDLAEIVVTGTHLRGVSTASPLMEIGREEIERSGHTSLATLMLSVPQDFGGGINPGTILNNGSPDSRFADNPTGASVPNLRGLGPGSTLTLIDGHRMASDLAGGGADIGSIPLDAIERVEIVTDSASAIYGSDAVAGVINIILKKDYEGAKTDLGYGFTSQGGGTQRQASQLAGTSWASGNLMAAYEYLHTDPIDASKRDFTSAAAVPSSLQPETKSHSLTLSGRQEVTSAASLFLDGIYVARDANRYNAELHFVPAPFEYPASLRKFAVAAGADFDLWRDWKATIFMTEAEDRTQQSSIMLTSPITPEGAEQSISTLRGIEASANGEIVRLPTGEVRLALGGGYRHEGFSDSFGTTGGTLEDSVSASRSIRYGFAEMSIPLVTHSHRTGLQGLDFVLSGRSERYSDAGSKTVPKIGLVYQPFDSLKLRGSWGKAFKAPNLSDSESTQQLILINLPDPSVVSGSSPTLVRSGGNPGLRPESATAWSIGADYAPAETGLKVSTTAFEIKYQDRIAQLGNPFAALTDPLNAFFVTPSSSAPYAQSVVGAYPPNEFFNFTGAPFDPAAVKAVVDFRLVNVARQTARGADLAADYRFDLASGIALLFLNGTYLDLTQQNTPQSGYQTLSGLAFYPPKFRARAGAMWKPASWTIAGTVNYLPHETNTLVAPSAGVGSWTTVDGSINYAPPLKGRWGGLNLSLSALNLLNKSPPFLATRFQGLNFDSSNTSPVGRFVTLRVSKEW